MMRLTKDKATESKCGLRAPVAVVGGQEGTLYSVMAGVVKSYVQMVSRMKKHQTTSKQT